MADTEFLTRKNAARYIEARGIPLSPRTLEQMAIAKRGPPYTLFNETRAIYRREDIDKWIESRMGRPLKTG